MDNRHPLTEAECYARCYGERGLGYVRVISNERPSHTPGPAAREALQAFEDRMSSRAHEAA